MTARRRFIPRVPSSVAESFALDTVFVPAVLAVTIIWLSTTSSVFLTGPNIHNVLNQMVMLAIVAFGGTFVILAREIDLSVGAGAALVSVFCADVMTKTGSIPIALLVGLGVGVLIGVVNGALVTLLEVPSFIATLGTLVIMRGIALHWTNGGIIAGLPGSFDRLSSDRFLGLEYIVWLMIVTFVVLLAVQKQTTFGLRVFAVGGNPEAARLAGLPVKRVRFLVFVISGVCIGLAGSALTARVQSGQPNGAFLLELYAVAAIVMGGTSLFGGRGSIVRTLAGVLLIQVLQNGLDLKGVGFDLQQVIIGSVLIAAASVDFVRRRLGRRAAGLARPDRRTAPPTGRKAGEGPETPVTSQPDTTG
jgi:ribose transport system permease protein